MRHRELACVVCQDRRVVLLAYGDPYVPSRELGEWVFARREYPCPECRPEAYAARCAELGETDELFDAQRWR